MAKSDPPLKPEAPDILKKLKWLQLHWKEYWLLIAVALAVLGILSFIDWKQILEKGDDVTLRPRLDWTTNHNPAANFSGIVIKNNGLGPAVVKPIYLYVDDKLLGLSSYENWRLALRILGIDYEWVSMYMHKEEHHLLSGQLYEMFGVYKEDYTPRRLQQIKSLSKRLNFGICYCSITGTGCQILGKKEPDPCSPNNVINRTK